MSARPTSLEELRAMLERVEALARETAKLQLTQADAFEKLLEGNLILSAAVRQVNATNEAIVNALPMIAKLLQTESLLERERKTEEAVAETLKRRGKVLN